VTITACIALYFAVLILRGNVKSRILNLMISGDQTFFSIITQGSSAPDETMSAAAFRLEQQGRWPGKVFRPLIDWFFFIDPMHCRTSYEAEVRGWQQARKL